MTKCVLWDFAVCTFIAPLLTHLRRMTFMVLEPGGHKAHGFSPNCCRLVTRLRRQAKKVSKHQLAVQTAKPENFSSQLHLRVEGHASKVLSTLSGLQKTVSNLLTVTINFILPIYFKCSLIAMSTSQGLCNFVKHSCACCFTPSLPWTCLQVSFPLCWEGKGLRDTDELQFSEGSQ